MDEKPEEYSDNTGLEMEPKYYIAVGVLGLAAFLFSLFNLWPITSLLLAIGWWVNVEGIKRGRKEA